MKQKDIALIIAVVAISAVFSILISNWLVSSPKKRQEKVEIVEALSEAFPTPDNQYFNPNSIDPTKLITIGNNNNPAPFNQ